MCVLVAIISVVHLRVALFLGGIVVNWVVQNEVQACDTSTKGSHYESAERISFEPQ